MSICKRRHGCSELNMIQRSSGWLFVKIFLLWGCLLYATLANVVGALPPPLGVGVRQVVPTRVTQFVRTTVTVALNTSLCEDGGQDVVSDAQLIIPKAAADGTDLAFRSGASTQNSCTNLQFRVLLGDEAQAGQYQAYVLLPGLQRSLQLPGLITVVTLPMLSMKSRVISVPADQTAFAIEVDLSYPAGDAGVSVKLQLLDSGAARIWDSTLSWTKGASGTQSFRANLQYIPEDSRLTVQLVQPQGAVLDPSASTTAVTVQSPVIGFRTGLGYYQGINTSAPLIYLTVSGSSTFPSGFNFSTYVLPGSRPSVPCHPLASTCSSADQESVDGVTVNGSRWLQPGQQQIDPIQLPVDWGRLPLESELRIGVRIMGKSNVRVQVQMGEVATIVFGTPMGMCPPGSAVLSDTNSSRGADGPTYTNVAALQELAFTLSAPQTASSNSSSGSSSSNDSLIVSAAAAGDPDSSSSSSSGSSLAATLDLDPPFSPMVDKYVGLLPPKPRGQGRLLLASNRWGDAVVVDATACLGLNSSRYQVQWGKQQQMWRQSFRLAGQKSPCWLRVHVFTMTAAYPGAPPTYRGSSGSSGANGDDNSSSSNSSNTTSSTWDLPDDFVLYRTYTIRFIPLKSPEQLSLRSITFSNNVTTVIACGVPRALSRYFETSPPLSLSSVMGMDDSSNNSSSSSNSTVINGDLNSLLAPGAAGHPRISGGLAVAATGSSEATSSSSAAAAAGTLPVSRDPQPLVPVPGQIVRVAYLVSEKSLAMKELRHTDASGQQQQQQGQTADSGISAAAAGGLSTSERPVQQQYSLFDSVSNRTIVWNRFTSMTCAQDRYVLLPLTQLKADMKMVPELVDPDAEGVDIQMTQSAVAMISSSSAAKGSSTAGPNGNGSSGTSSSGTTTSNSGGGSSALSVLESSAKAGILGLKRLGFKQGACSSSSSSSSVEKEAAASSALLSSRVASNSSLGSGSSSSDPCGIRLPGVTAEVPIILTADEGRSSKTYTLLLYSNESAAAAVQNLVLPQEAAAAESAGNSSGSSPGADAAQRSAAFFASRPKSWPASPAQSDRCAVCPNGTYSTRVDAHDCKVCPPGKYAATPFSTGCLFCPPGSFSYYWGAPACRKCLPGTSAAHAGSLFCDICKDGTTTYSEGSTACDIAVTADGSALDALSSATDSEYALLLSFGVVLDGALLEAVSRSTTGINGSSEGIVSVLVRSDTASALNVSLGSVQVNGVQQLDSRQLLINVSAAVPVSEDQAQKDGATADAQDLAADELIQRLIDDPNTFLRTTQTLGAEGVSVQDLTTLRTRRLRWGYYSKLHAIFWPSLIGSLFVIGLLGYFLWRWRRRRRVQRLTQQLAGGLEFAASAAANGIADFLSMVQQPQRPGLVGSPARLGPHRVAGGGGDVGMHVNSTSSSSSSRGAHWKRSWQRFWSSDVRLVVGGSPSNPRESPTLDSPPRRNTLAAAGGAAGDSSGSSFGRSSSASAGSCGSCSPASSKSGSGCSDGVSITLDIGDIRPSGAGGGDFCYNEESFQARLRAKQLGVAEAASPNRW